VCVKSGGGGLCVGAVQHHTEVSQRLSANSKIDVSVQCAIAGVSREGGAGCREAGTDKKHTEPVSSITTSQQRGEGLCLLLTR
jgi:hypothetical protein